jgi:hypothetical protein
MGESLEQKEDGKASAERIKEIATGSTRVALIWFAALILVWATKIEPSFGPVIRYQNAVKRKKLAEKQYRRDLRVMRDKIEEEPVSEKKPGEPSIRWRFKTAEEQRGGQPTAFVTKDSDTIRPSLTDSTTNKNPNVPTPSEEDSSTDETTPPYFDRERLNRLNTTLRTLTKISLDAEARKASATTVEFELLNYKFLSSVLYAPIVWNLFFFGLLVYLFSSRQRLIKLIVRYTKLSNNLRLYHAPWWVAPLPRLSRGSGCTVEKVRRIIGWPEGTKRHIIAVVVMLLLAAMLQGRVAQIGLEVTKTIGSGSEATWLSVAYYAIFILFALLAFLWFLPRDYRPNEGNSV